MNTKQDVEALRREYSARSLTENSIADNAIAQFAIWFKEALDADIPEPNAMTLATASSKAVPSARIVLLKGFDEKGFRFYTNYESRKGRDLEENSHAALCFFWHVLERQVRIEGEVEKLTREDSAAYFKKRPRLSQLGAWASSQSSEVKSRAALEQHFQELQKNYEGKDIPVPDFWGGYLLKPSSIEFWQGRPGRLHDRILYKKQKDQWQISRLSP